MGSKTILLADGGCVRHETGVGHPEAPERFGAVMGALDRAGLTERLEHVEGRLAVDEDLLLVHTTEYLRTVEEDFATGARMLSTGDTNVSPASLGVARKAAGMGLAAVDAVMEGRAKRAFCAVRPPGHHATPTRGMGFCLFNNIAVAARHAQRRHGAERVLIVDWDVHHGNGTQDAFYRDGSVLFFSTHQHPWYPGTGMEWETGESSGEGATVNVPLPAGSGREEVLRAVRDELLLRADGFRPDLLLVSAGFDSRRADPLGQFLLDDSDFEELTDMLLEVADKHSEGRLVSLLEGGYSLTGLGAGVAAHVGRLVEAGS